MKDEDDAVLDLVCRRLPGQDVSACRVYVESQTHDVGDAVRVGLREVAMPFRGRRVLVDLMPGANWGHPVVYLLASEDFAEGVRYDEQFPPFVGDAPPGWRMVPATG